MHWTQKNPWWVYHVESVSKMGLVILITFSNIWGCMCWSGPFGFRWLKVYIHNPSYYNHPIGSIHLSHCCHIFFRGCASEMVVLSYSVIYYIYPGTLRPFFHYWCSVYGICNWSDTLIVSVCLLITPSHYHHYADVSEGIELLKCWSGICCRVCV